MPIEQSNHRYVADIRVECDNCHTETKEVAAIVTENMAYKPPAGWLVFHSAFRGYGYGGGPSYVACSAFCAKELSAEAIDKHIEQERLGN